MSTLELRGLHKAYGTVQVLRDIDLDVAPGSRTAIVGPSGSGKTTLLRLVAGFDTPDAGTIRLEGRLLADGPVAVAAHQRRIGFVPQDGALFPHLSITANIGFGLAEKGAERARRIDELMDMVSLDRSMLKRAPHELSGGQQQRVALARALAQRPHLMLLDEPFSALDTGLRAATRKAVAQMLGEAGITTVLVTHDQAEALSFADQLAVMREGRLVQSGRPLDVYRRPLDEATARFLGEAIVLPARLDLGFASCDFGRVPVSDPRRQGPGRILLRPEQLQLSRASDAPPNDIGFEGVVAEIDFGGADCSVLVRRDAGTAPVQVRSSSLDVPLIGARVHVSVVGMAHVLEGQDAAASS